MSSERVARFADLMMRHRKAILFLTICLCLAGVYSATQMPSAVFPRTDFPRVVVLVDNGVMPSDEMMATVTRPIEEAVKGIPGVVNIRSSTGRGSAEVNVFFDWQTDMIRAELYVLGRIAQVKNSLPATATADVHRMTFSEFPIIGISLTSPTRNITDLWEKARYDIKPRFLRIPGVARVDIVGGRVPEYHVIVDPLKLEGEHLTLDEVSQALATTNVVAPAGMHEEDYQFYLTTVDGRVSTAQADRKRYRPLGQRLAGPHRRRRHGQTRQCPSVQHRHGGRPRRGAAECPQSAGRQYTGDCQCLADGTGETPHAVTAGHAPGLLL